MCANTQYHMALVYRPAGWAQLRDERREIRAQASDRAPRSPRRTSRAMSSSEYENLIRVVRTDADARRRLVLKACFLAALAEHAPAVVKHPTREKKWRKGDLDAIAAGTLARVKNDGPRSELHCVVGVDDFNANLRYAKGSLVYLRAETKPPLRVLLYASLPPPTRAETPPPTVASGGGANDAAEREKRAAAANAAAANGVKIVDAGAATEETLALIVAALSSEPPPSTAEAGEEKIATWASSKARDALTFAHGAFWHVVHDQHVFGAAVRATGAGGGEDNDNAKGGGRFDGRGPGAQSRRETREARVHDLAPQRDAADVFTDRHRVRGVDVRVQVRSVHVRVRRRRVRGVVQQVLRRGRSQRRRQGGDVERDSKKHRHRGVGRVREQLAAERARRRDRALGV